MNRDADSSRLSRRALLQRAGLAGAVLAGVQLTGCSDPSSSQPTAGAPAASGRSSPTATGAGGVEAAGTTAPTSSTATDGAGRASVLMAFFSRAGENYFDGWNVRPPMIMSTFLDGVDLTGKRLAPLVTYAVSGLGRTIDVYTALATRRHDHRRPRRAR